jgi:LacI family transcriptional regulator, xylobiose transport system transcriptional regulator
MGDGHRRGRPRGELTVAMVARLAGVSSTTVSKVLNGHTGVGAETRRRVETLLHEHGYRRPKVAGPAAAIDVVFYGLEGEITSLIMEGVAQVARQQDLAVVFTEATDPVAGGRTWAEQLLARHPLGVIAVHSHFIPHQHARLAVSGIPLVALDPMGEPTHDTPSVGATNWNGGVQAARHLLELGHRRIAVISGPAQYLVARARLAGCRAALEAAGAPLADRLVRTGHFWFQDGLELAEELLRQSPPPTGIICGNDLQALGVYEAARRTGLRIPQDLSVIGFDDISVARWCAPPLTTVRQPFAEMSATAARMLLSLVAGEPPAQSRVELGTTLVVRDSTAAPAAAGGVRRSGGHGTLGQRQTATSSARRRSTPPSSAALA